MKKEQIGRALQVTMIVLLISNLAAMLHQQPGPAFAQGTVGSQVFMQFKSMNEFATFINTNTGPRMRLVAFQSTNDPFFVNAVFQRYQ